MDEKVLNFLNQNWISYTLYEHEPLFTCQQSQNIFPDLSLWHTKNLFLTDDKKSRFYLVCMSATKKADLKVLAEALGEKRFSFAKEEYLQKYLGIKPWSVSIFGLINDVDRKVNLVIDEYLRNWEKLFAHPNVNTKTLELKIVGIKKYLEILWIDYKIIKI